MFYHFSINPVNSEATEAQNWDNRDAGIWEEKVYSTATLEDDFAEDCVLVVLTNSASVARFDYSVSDFSEIDCISVAFVNISDMYYCTGCEYILY